MRHLTLLASTALIAAAVATPSAAHATTVTQVIASSRCLGGPGTATVVSSPAADGSSTLAFTMAGVPDGSWNGGVTLAGVAGLTPAPQTVTGGTFTASTTSAAPWNSVLAVGAYANTGTGELCEALAAQQGSVSVASTLNVALAVHDVRKFAAGVVLTRAVKGHRVKVALVLKAGRTQRRTEVVTIKRTSQNVVFKGLKQVKPYTSASVVVTDLKTHGKESVTLRRVLG